VRALKLLGLAALSALVAGAVMSLHYPRLPLVMKAADPPAYMHPRQHEPLELTRLPRDAAAEAAERAVVVRAMRRRIAFDTKLANGAAVGFDRSIFSYSPGGVVGTAVRVARWKPLIVRAARGSGISPNLVEAMVFVESSGYRDAVGSGRRVGLLQLTPWSARSLGVRVSRRKARVLASARHRVDDRYRAVPSLRAAVRYLVHARHRLGRADLAVASYHLGVKNLVLATGGESVSFASLYFGAAPDRDGGAWRRLNRNGENARDYYWRVLAAQRVMRLYRHDRSALIYEDELQARKNSAEEVMHPHAVTPRFHRPLDLVRAWKRHTLKRIPSDTRATHIAFAGSFAQMAPKLRRSRRLYHGLRPSAERVLMFIGRRVHELSHSRRPLILTSAVRDDVYQRRLMRVNANAAHSYSIHTTGFAFDIARSYATRRQAAAFEYVLERLEALRVIAYIREAQAIHVAVARKVSPSLLRRLV